MCAADPSPQHGGGRSAILSCALWQWPQRLRFFLTLQLFVVVVVHLTTHWAATNGQSRTGRHVALHKSVVKWTAWPAAFPSKSFKTPTHDRYSEGTTILLNVVHEGTWYCGATACISCLKGSPSTKLKEAPPNSYKLSDEARKFTGLLFWHTPVMYPSKMFNSGLYGFLYHFSMTCSCRSGCDFDTAAGNGGGRWGSHTHFFPQHHWPVVGKHVLLHPSVREMTQQSPTADFSAA